jgi:NitT/TauT family transport system ATP-binding protein
MTHLAEPAEPMLVLEGVEKDFTDVPGGTLALSGVDLRVAAGEFVAIVGPSGAGKSTLLRLIADLTPLTAGRIRVCGHRPAEARRRRDFGMVFQSPVLYAWRKVLANVELPLEIQGIPREERRRRALASLERVGLTDVAERYPRQLSGGMQQRVAIARAMVVQPRILLMDEPFGSLDELTRERLELELLELWQATGVTVLFVTHAIEEAVFLADRVLVLGPRPGRFAAEIPIALSRPRGEHSRTELTYFEAVNRVRGELRRAMGVGEAESAESVGAGPA